MRKRKTTIAIVNQKGGVGKTTLTCLLANTFNFQFNQKVSIIDADNPQHSIAKRRAAERQLIEKNPKIKKAFDQVYKNDMEKLITMSLE